ncbi:YvrJ protein family protein [Fontibacillus panacisegetis]|uniref:YvrJ protein family protein n=1 Tax=Fontibacillus panacisegetis TaxID=670482 RepID=A0A1G7Q756_9BACL|nr:YvrJ family protein [Fontibacillus panacisegetis]SDF93759.1 YvrJ protein family protein [Fontibacillus panacisegetis]
MGEGQQPFTYLLTAISQVGFPIVLTAYLLTRFEKKLDKLTESKRAKVRKSMENDLFDLV